MSTPESLKDIYADEIKDLWSANDQMARAVKAMAGRVHDTKLKQMLESSHEGINKHAETLKGLLEKADEEVKPEKCQGMAGLASEAEKHTSKEAPKDGELLDIVVLSQYQSNVPLRHFRLRYRGNLCQGAGTQGRRAGFEIHRRRYLQSR